MPQHLAAIVSETERRLGVTPDQGLEAQPPHPVDGAQTTLQLANAGSLEFSQTTRALAHATRYAAPQRASYQYRPDDA